MLLSDSGFLFEFNFNMTLILINKEDVTDALGLN